MKFVKVRKRSNVRLRQSIILIRRSLSVGIIVTEFFDFVEES